jgi:hypothetical protein
MPKTAETLEDFFKLPTDFNAIDISHETIDITDFARLVKELETNETIISLTLLNNDMSAKRARELANSLKVNKTLTSLSLAGNRIKDEGAIEFANLLEKNNTLTSLNLSGNQIGDKGATALAESLRTNKTLASLDLGSNKIGNDGAKALFEMFKENIGLTNVYFYNMMGNDGVKVFVEELKENLSLTDVNLGYIEKGNPLGDLLKKITVRNIKYLNEVSNFIKLHYDNNESDNKSEHTMISLKDAYIFQKLNPAVIMQKLLSFGVKTEKINLSITKTHKDINTQLFTFAKIYQYEEGQTSPLCLLPKDIQHYILTFLGYQSLWAIKTGSNLIAHIYALEQNDTPVIGADAAIYEAS